MFVTDARLFSKLNAKKMHFWFVGYFVVVCLSVKFGIQESCLWKRNDKYKVWIRIVLEQLDSAKIKIVFAGNLVHCSVEMYHIQNICFQTLHFEVVFSRRDIGSRISGKVNNFEGMFGPKLCTPSTLAKDLTTLYVWLVHYCTLSLSDIWVTSQIANGQYKDYLDG